jgi:hypothetical protein
MNSGFDHLTTKSLPVLYSLVIRASASTLLPDPQSNTAAKVTLLKQHETLLLKTSNGFPSHSHLHSGLQGPMWPVSFLLPLWPHPILVFCPPPLTSHAIGIPYLRACTFFFNM